MSMTENGGLWPSVTRSGCMHMRALLGLDIALSHCMKSVIAASFERPAWPSLELSKGKKMFGQTCVLVRCAIPRYYLANLETAALLSRLRVRDSLAEAVIFERDSMACLDSSDIRHGCQASEKSTVAVLPGVCHLALNPFLRVELRPHPASDPVSLLL